MPELDDLGSLPLVAGADLTSLDKIPVFHAATRTVREVAASDIGGGTVDNATVAAAIATDPAAVRAAAGVSQSIQNQHALAPFYEKFQKLNDPATNPYLGITLFGDSMCSGSYTPGYILQRLQNIYGTGAVGTPGLCTLGWSGAAWTYTGGAAFDNTDYDRFPAGEMNIPAAGSAEITFPGVSTAIRRGSGGNFGGLESALGAGENYFNMPKGVKSLTVIYMKQPGSGTLDITVEQAGAADQTATIACNDTEALASTNFTPTNRAGAITVNLAATGGTVVALGVVFWGESGVFSLSSAVGGTSMSQQSACLASSTFKQPYKDLLSLLGITSVFHAQRAGVETTPEIFYEQFFDAYTEAGMDQIVFSEPPYVGNEVATESINDYLQTESQTRGFPYYDQYSLATSAEITALGWGDDAAHLDGQFHQYSAGIFLRETGEFRNAVTRFSRGQQTGRITDGMANGLLALTLMKQECIRGHTGFTTETAATSGGYTFPVNNERGFSATAAAAIGYSVARIGFFAGGDAGGMEIADNVTFTGTGYRNLTVPADAKGYILFGTSTVNITTLTGLTQKVVGLEFQKSDTIGEAHLTSGLNCVRIIACDGTTTTVSPWVLAEVSPAGQNGFNFALTIDDDAGQIFLTSGDTRIVVQGNSPQLRLSLPMPTMPTDSLSGGWVQIGIESATGTATGALSFKELKMIKGGIVGQFID